MICLNSLSDNCLFGIFLDKETHMADTSGTVWILSLNISLIFSTSRQSENCHNLLSLSHINQLLQSIFTHILPVTYLLSLQSLLLAKNLKISRHLLQQHFFHYCLLSFCISLSLKKLCSLIHNTDFAHLPLIWEVFI